MGSVVENQINFFCGEILIGSAAAHSRDIRIGSGGVMLLNHAPLRIAEAYRTLEALHHLGPLCQKDIGKKLLKDGPIAARELVKAAADEVSELLGPSD
mgnify:CR=1 FL=1